MLCLISLLEEYIRFAGNIAYGGRGGYSAIELIMVFRLLIEKAIEWKRPIFIIKADIARAFDTLSHSAIIEWAKTLNILIRLKFALLKKVLGTKYICMAGSGIQTDWIRALCGLRQGSVEASLIFAHVVCWILKGLEDRWKSRGLGWFAGSFGGCDFAFADFFDKHLGHFTSLDPNNLYASICVFLDDLYIVCTCVQMGQVMLDELVQALASYGLRLHHKPCLCGTVCNCKCQWMCDVHTADSLCEEQITINGIVVRRVDKMNILGSIVCADATEGPAIEHRITQSWRCFHKWAHIFSSKATIESKLQFWKKTVFRSMTWGVETLREDNTLVGKLATAHKFMVRKMLGLKRRPQLDDHENVIGVEKWLDYFKRSMSRAGSEIRKVNMEMQALINGERIRWASHLSRMGLDGKTEHLCKALVAWRCKSWWKSQQFYNSLNWEVLRHPFPFKPSRWEDQFPDDWITKYSNFPTPN